MGQSVPPERKDRSQKGDFPQSLRHYAGGRFVCAERCGGKAAAIAVSGPFGAVKERSSSLYAQRMAEYGFLTLAFDPSFTRLLPARAADSPGMVLPRTSTSKISALRWIFCPYRTMQTRRASGSSASAVGAVWRSAAQDTRIKATAAMTMYDMTRVNANGYFDSEDTADACYEKRRP